MNGVSVQQVGLSHVYPKAAEVLFFFFSKLKRREKYFRLATSLHCVVK